ncbi:hypothetical protein HDU97_007254 [Phlyctochytrium planicorne]|nr:hypothetical protein HDU97_007254 [Phlyctochytrium planicorne]
MADPSSDMAKKEGAVVPIMEDDANGIELKPTGPGTFEPLTSATPGRAGVGKVVPVEIVARNLSVTAVSRGLGKKTEFTPLIQDVNLHVPSGHLMAIMGGSGSGKTTLLNALAGRSNAKIEGQILFNGESPRKFLRGGAVAYVQQHDSLLPYLTVRDTLRYAARLRLPRTMSIQKKDEMVESVILELGLKECANTLIGDEWRKGISGGEKRRVSVGVQLLLNPSVIFMDEPTTGLDAFSARSLVETLTSLCSNGQRTIIISIHQPRSDIFTAFSFITLLASRGRLAYSGTRDGAIAHFESLGFAPEMNVNGADFLIDMTTVDNRSLESEEKSAERVDSIVKAWGEKNGAAAGTAVTGEDVGKTGAKCKVLGVTLMEGKGEATDFPIEEDSSRYGHKGATFFEQVYVLTGRVLANMKEDRMTLWGSIIEVFFLGIVMGSIFYQLDESPGGILSRKSLLYSVCALQNYLGLMFIIYKLCNELIVFDRERADKMYSVPAYLLSWFSVNIFLYAGLAVIFSTLIYFMVGLRSDDLSYHFGIFALNNIMMQLVTISLGYFCVSLNRGFATASLIGNSFFTFLSMSSGFFIPLNSIPVYLRWFEKISYITYGLKIHATNEFDGKVYACPGLPAGVPACRGETALEQLGMQPGLVVPFIGLASIIVVLLLVTALNLQFVPSGGTKQAGKVNVGAPPALVETAADGKAVEVDDEVVLPKVTLALRNVSLTFVRKLPFAKSPKASNPILREVNASFKPASLSVILGTSGAGKSTLLQLLHSRTPRLPSFTKPHQEGTMEHNGRVLSAAEVAVLTASVRQDDSHLLPALTARETLMYAAMLRLPHLTKKERAARAEKVLWELGLKDCADTVVGGEGVKGLSGGEKRRLSVGLAMLTDPAVLLLDEPTSGLDAFTASNMIHLLKQIAAKGRTVICTIHQPRSDLFPLFDSILLLARGGRVVYEGSGPGMLEFFSSMGHVLPPLTNPADFALDVSSVDLRGDDVERESRKRVDGLVEAWRDRSKREVVVQGSSSTIDEEAAASTEKWTQSLAKLGITTSSKPLPFFMSLPILVGRSFVNLRRQFGLVSARIFQGVALGVILTLYFARLKMDASVTSRIGFLQQVGALVFIGMLNCIAVFPQELRLFRFEHQDGVYSIESFFWTYTINEIPFDAIGGLLFGVLAHFAIGIKINVFLISFFAFTMVVAGESIGMAFCSLISQPGFSVQIMSALISIMSIMMGFLSVNMPAYLNAINHISILRYIARVQAREEFLGLVFECTDAERQQPGTVCTGEDALKLIGFDSSYGAMQVALIGVLATVVAYRLVAYGIMRWRL